MEHHPDMGGDLEVMKAVNNEYDRLFPVWKGREKVTTTESAGSTRREFYTQNGWKGENYESGRDLKEIAEIVRTYCKEVYSAYRFSVTTSYASMCCSLHVALMEAPHEALKAPGNGHEQLNQYAVDRDDRLTDLDRMGGGYLDAYKMDKKLKNVCKGDVRGNRFFVMQEKFRKWAEQGSIEFVELREVVETYEAEKTVKRLVRPEIKIGGEKPAAEPPDRAKETAEEIEDASTDIIHDLRLRPGEYLYHTKYKARLEAYLDTLGDRLNERTIVQIEYDDLRKIVRSIFEKRKDAPAA